MSAQSEPSRVPVASVAASSIHVERRSVFAGRSVIQLGTALQDHPSGPIFKAVGGTASTQVHRLEDVVLDADTLLLLKDGRIISETEYFNPPYDSNRQSEAVEDLRSDEVLIYGYNAQHWGYQHWLVQCLPAIDWSLRQAGKQPARLILPELSVWQESFLHLLGCAGLPRLTPVPDSRYRVPNVLFCDFVYGASTFDVSPALMDTVRRLSEAVPDTQSPHKILFVLDPNPYYGSIINATEVVALLLKHGVTLIDTHDANAALRINLFRNAEVVIGTHSQYLADVVFCRPGALLWEWMPRHLLNQTYNRLAQAAGVDYWGDLFESAEDPVNAGDWIVDLGVLEQRLAMLSARPAPCGEPSAPDAAAPAGMPLESLLLRFESLGDSCEFGFVQRAAGVDPLGLFRFNGIYVPPEFRLEKMVAALERRFEGLGTAETISVAPEGIEGQRELMVRESEYELYYHTGIAEGAVALDVQVEREVKRLTFLRGKLLDDLAAGEKTVVWKCDASRTVADVRPLLAALRRIGPNTLLWVTLADADHPPGSAELLEPGLIKGYVRRFAPADNAADIDAPAWLAVCARAEAIRNAPAPETTAVPGSGEAVLEAARFADEPLADAGPVSDDRPEQASTAAPTVAPRLPSAMDFLANNSATPVARPVRQAPAPSRFETLRRWFGLG